MDRTEPTEISSATATRAGRRKVLGLGTAVPMVLTLRPGSSFAMSANCGQRQNHVDTMRSERAEKLTETDDEWVRARVKVLQLVKKGNGKPEELEGEYIRQMDFQGGKYWRVDDGQFQEVVFGPFENIKESRVGERYAMVSVDPDSGAVVDYSWSPKASQGMKVSNGCMASMMMGKRNTPWRRIWG